MTNLFKDIFGKDINLIKLDMNQVHDMWKYSNDPKMYEHFEFGPPKSISDTKDYLKRLITRSNGIDAYWWFIQLKETKKIVGSFGVHDIDYHKKSCEISYGLSPSLWGKGVFINALNLVLDRFIRQFDFYRITAVTSSNNIRSIKALKKIGFKEEGSFRDFYLKDNGVRYNATILSLLAHEFQNFDS
jgi:ribosomal-protein-alanine N-acetyltransferase